MRKSKTTTTTKEEKKKDNDLSLSMWGVTILGMSVWVWKVRVCVFRLSDMMRREGKRQTE